jgi:hypothetical protein
MLKLLFLLLPLASLGQVKDTAAKAILSRTPMYFTDTTSIRQDTTRCIIFFVDTSLIYSITNNIIPYYDPNIHWQFGYEVTRQVYVPAGTITQNNNIYGWGDYTKIEIIAYLDSRKVLLPKSIFVLQIIKL